MSFDEKQRLERVLGLSLDYILSHQREDGSWVDWDLPPGQSCLWATAFVGYRLRNIPRHLRKHARAAMQIASDWLLGRVFPDGGWGYSETVGSDADSTALAILFLSSEGKTVPDTCYSCLQRFQCPDGGFATYRHNGVADSWGVSHLDVTPTAILALLTKYGRQAEIVERGIDYVIKKKTSDGVWESFWWTSFLYSTESSVALMNTIASAMDLPRTRATLLASQINSAFERALLLLSLTYLHPKPSCSDIWPLIGQLVHDQEANGSWRSDPILRITRHDCFEPWKPGDPDTLFADTNRLFTTSIVIEALSSVYALL